MLIKLRRKFIAAMVLVSTLVLCILLTTIYQSVAANLQAESLRMMQLAEQRSSYLHPSPDIENPEPRIYYFILSKDAAGNPVVRENSGFQLDDKEMLTALYHTVSADSNSSGELRKYSLRYLRVGNAPEISYIFADISDELSILTTLRKGCIAIGLVSMLVIFTISSILARWMIAPVAKTWQLQKQFVADASHELKTPLTVILTNTDLLTSPDYSEEEKAGLVDGIAVMAARMRQLVEGMLDLARVDSGVVKSAFELLNYSELVEQSMLPFEPAFFECGRVLESRIAPHILLRGSPQHLMQVTDILLDNAMKYSSDGSTVRLILHKQGRHALLCVDSCGAPLSPRQCKEIFRRFYSADSARTGDSYGLGLSIAQAIVEEHGGEIWAESSGGHNRFYVKLPL